MSWSKCFVKFIKTDIVKTKLYTILYSSKSSWYIFGAPCWPHNGFGLGSSFWCLWGQKCLERGTKKFLEYRKCLETGELEYNRFKETGKTTKYNLTIHLIEGILLFLLFIYTLKWFYCFFCFQTLLDCCPLSSKCRMRKAGLGNFYIGHFFYEILKWEINR